MTVYALIAALVVLALYLQWKDGLSSFGNTLGGMQLVRALWFSASVFFGIAIDRLAPGWVAVVGASSAYVLALAVVRAFEGYIVAHGTDPSLEGRPLARLVQAEARRPPIDPR